MSDTDGFDQFISRVARFPLILVFETQQTFRQVFLRVLLEGV